MRVVLTVVPLLASVGFVWFASQWFPAPHDASVGIYVLWWLALSAAGSVVLLVADRAGRRLLPLAALLRLSLVFPDAAPSRFRAALQAGKVRRLEDRLQLVRDARDADTPNESAERLLTLVAALSEHDKLTRGHSERVRAYAVMIGEEMRLDPAELDLLNWAALLHDIGKLDVSGEILRKPGRPTEAEWEQLQAAPAPRRAARRTDGRLARRLVQRGRVPPRTLGRRGLSARRRRGRDPAGGADRGDRGCVRRDHLRAVVQGGRRRDRGP